MYGASERRSQHNNVMSVHALHDDTDDDHEKDEDDECCMMKRQKNIFDNMWVEEAEKRG